MAHPSRAGAGRRSHPGRPPVASPVPALPPLAVTHPAWILVAAVAAAFCLIAVAYPLSTPDIWQHLLVGKVMWLQGRIPMEHLWTWPLQGTPEALPSWAFRWALWPFWQVGEVWGMQAWRSLTTLAAFAIALWTARLLGARGFAPLFVIAVAVLSYRARAQVRPETLVAVLVALQVAVLERRRLRGGGALLLVAIAWVWANVHISYYLGYMLISFHMVGEWLARQRGGGVAVRQAGVFARLDHAPLWAALVGAVAVSFVNPYGWRALAQPFEYFFIWRHEAIYQTIPELRPLFQVWPNHLRSGLPFLVVVWPMLVLGRAVVRRFDPVEAMTCLLFVGHTLFNQRFSGALAVGIVPYLARDLSELAGALRYPAALRRPGVRAALAVAAMTLASLAAWNDRRFPIRVGLIETAYPIGACDFIEQHGLAGRMFNPFYFGGYIMWRFWPQSERLPFMDIHQSGTRADRDLYARSFADSSAWNQLDNKHGFEMALLDGHQEWVVGDRLVDRFDADSRWALVFRDDAAALYVRRGGRNAAAESLAYRVMPGGADRFEALGARVARDTALRRVLREDLIRAAGASKRNAWAHSYLASLAFLDNDPAGSRRHLEASLAAEPGFEGAHRRLGYLLMAEGEWTLAIQEFEQELALGAPPADEFMRLGEACEQLGNAKQAAAWYRRELDVHVGNNEARLALARVQGVQR